MGKSLIIVESPSKAKTINKYLGKEYVVEASVGHIKNLPKSKLGVDVENRYAATFETIAGKEEVVAKLRSIASNAKTVFVATDPDREGEAIAYDIAEELEQENPNIFRVLFHEITPTGIQEGMSQPRKIDRNLVESQRARRAMDRLVGYKVSPFLWKTVYYGLSAGRVQSVALRLICEREEEIKAFTPEEYWSITGEFKTAASEPFFAKLAKISGKEPKVGNEERSAEVVADIRRQSYAIADLQKKTVKRNPNPPFITSTLQQEAASRLRLSAKRTMMLAQRLYEGVDLGDDGTVGLITYMRTDSTRLSEEATAAAREHIYSNYGAEYLPKEPRVYKKGKASQDAHEAIRPTSIKFSPKYVKKHLEKEMYALYTLIWNRFIASQMASATFEQVSVDIAGGPYLFRATGSVPVFRGFLQVYDDILEEQGIEDDDPTSKIPANLNAGDRTDLTNVLPRQHFTKPPARFTEASLVKKLEELGIGRPSTYAQIVSTILDRKYVDQQDRKLVATALGMTVTGILKQSFPDVVNFRFTAQMEDELETIASGENTYVQVLDDFYRPFSHSLEHLNEQAGKIKKSLQQDAGEACDLCGKPMIIKWGRYGQFKACSGYPTCKNRKPLHDESAKYSHMAGIVCKVCGGEMKVKGGPFGAFLGCSNYPKCTNTQPITTGVKCPKCKDGDIIESKTRRKRVFYRCSNASGDNKTCDFISWEMPVMQECKNCRNNYLLKKSSKRKGDFLLCPNCKEEYYLDEQEARALAL
ncbi:MAG: type I DNA topoisomerase [Bacteroidetes bacterium]|nr:MAG: type I DNA topoisomerase [Bacteroidota bacterium]